MVSFCQDCFTIEPLIRPSIDQLLNFSEDNQLIFVPDKIYPETVNEENSNELEISELKSYTSSSTNNTYCPSDNLSEYNIDMKDFPEFNSSFTNSTTVSDTNL